MYVSLFLFHNWSNKYLELIKRRSKVQEKNMLGEHTLDFNQWKKFPKTTSQREFDYDFFTNLLRITVASNFSPSSFKLERGIWPVLTT